MTIQNFFTKDHLHQISVVLPDPYSDPDSMESMAQYLDPRGQKLLTNIKKS